MTNQHSQLWNEAERKLIDGILDEIIPASEDGRIPSAGSFGVAEYLNGVGDADPDLIALFQRGLSSARQLVESRGSDFDALDADGRRALVKALEKQEPEFFEALLRHTYMGYYSNASIRPFFGLSDRPTQPDGYDVTPESPEEMEALVEPVKSRGPCYRAC